MSDIVIVGCGAQVGKTAALMIALRERGHNVILAQRMPPLPPDPLELGKALLEAAMVREVPRFEPWPVPMGANLPKRAGWQAQARTGKRDREQRTRGK
jgi:hypothetical protein